MSDTYRNFQNAFLAWRREGGAMNYYDNPPMWEVAPVEEIAEMVEPEHTARYATEQALIAGGLSADDVAEYMEGWID